MDKLQRQVREFHKVINMPTSPAEPMLRLMDLRATIVAEEAIELVMALVGTARGQTVVIVQLTEVLQKMARAGHDGQPNLEEAIDACADTLVVTYGTLECIGVDGEPFTDEVMRANMTKQGGPIRSDGKQEKPPGWTPPDIAGVLANTTPPARNSCGCDGAFDDGCYNCKADWRCKLCGFPLAHNGPVRSCPHCDGMKFTEEEWVKIGMTGRLPPR